MNQSKLINKLTFKKPNTKTYDMKHLDLICNIKMLYLKFIGKSIFNSGNVLS